MERNCRKLLAVLLALAMALVLCSCSGLAPAESSSPENGGSSIQLSPESRPEPEPEQESEPEAVPEADGDPDPDFDPDPAPPWEFRPGAPKQDLSVDEIIDRVIDSYYVGSGEVDGPYKGGIPAPGPTIGAAIYWYTTGTGDRASMETLLEHLQTGAGLVPKLKQEDWVYSLVYDENGYLCGHVKTSRQLEQIIAADTFPAEEAESCRLDFRWPELVAVAVAEGKFQYPSRLRMRACDFEGFATGAVLYDGGMEYFVPTNGDALHSVPFEVGTLYPMDELVELLYSRLDNLFGGPPAATGAAG